jgi:hypothetical protein
MLLRCEGTMMVIAVLLLSTAGLSADAAVKREADRSAGTSPKMLQLYSTG